MEITGLTGSLRYGYMSAATLGDWTVRRGENGCWHLSAVVLAQTYRVAQRPLVFEAPHANGAFRWPVLELQAVEGSLTAILGPHEG